MAEKQTEEDASLDSKVAHSRPTSDGDPDYPETTTGPGGNDEFVGRAEGQDEGYTGETGAERRSAG